VSINPSDHLTYLMTQAAHGLGGLLDRALREHGVTLRQFGALAHIGRHPGISGADLAHRLHTSPQAVATLVRRMVAAGLIEHARTGQGVAAQLRLTELGADRLEVADVVAAATERSAFASIDQADRVVMERALRTLIGDMKGLLD
jgi:DNA-binding MarR family transcriptional regulator